MAEAQKEPETQKPTTDNRQGAKVVTNNHGAPIMLAGVAIQPGKSEPVPDYDPKHAVVKKWLAAKVISVK